MLSDLTASQHAGWLAWMRKTQPFPNRNDPYFAMLLSITANQWIAEASDRTTPDDFLIYKEVVEDVLPSPEELSRKLGLRH